MKKSLSCVLLASAFMLCLFAQSVMWETLIPFESDDDGPVGIDITDAGEILVAYYTNGPNESVWVEDSLIHSPTTKVARLNTSGDLINIDDHGQLFNHDVTGIGRTENGYSLSGNNKSRVLISGNWFYLPSALLIRFNQAVKDTILYTSTSDEGFESGKIKSSMNHKPITSIYKYQQSLGGPSEHFVIDLDDNLLAGFDRIAIPDTLDFSKHSLNINDVDMSADNNIIITGYFSDAIFQHLSFLICIDSENNVLWEHFYDIGWTESFYIISLSYTTDRGCLAGIYSTNHYLNKYNQKGIYEYSLGPYEDFILSINSIGNNEYIFMLRNSNIVRKLKDTGTELIEEWSLVLEGIKAVRAVENGFVAAGVKDANIWIKGFDATTGIEDISGKPSVTTLFQNHPNPFNPVTQIKFALAKAGDVKLNVYNISGQLVSQLASGTLNAGVHAVDFDGSRLNSGVYYYTLEVDGKSLTKRMLMVK